MPTVRYPTNLDTLKQKLHFQRVLGSIKACKYFDLIRRFLSQKVDKREFDRLCITTIGRENVHLHNHFINSILKACLRNAALPRQRPVEGYLNGKTPNGCNNLQFLKKDGLPRPKTVEGSLNTKTPNGCNNLQFLSKDRLPRPKTVEGSLNAKTTNGCNSPQFLCKDRPHSIQKCRTPNLRGHRVKIGPSPLGLPGKSSSIGIEDSAPKIHEQQSDIPVTSLAGKSSSIGIEVSAPKIHEQQSNIPLGLPGNRSSIGVENSAPKIHEQQSNIRLGLPGKSSSIGIEDSVPKIHKQQSNIPLDLPRKSSSIGIEDSAPKVHEQQSNIPLSLPGKSSSFGIQDSAPKIHEQQSNVPLGLSGKSGSIGIESSIPNLHYVGSRLPISVEDGGHVNKVSEFLAIMRSSIRAPLAIPTYNSGARKVLHKRLRSGTVTDTCQSTGQLPDTQCLMKRLKKNLETEGLDISDDAANLMNNALDVYLKRLIKPCLDLAASKSVKKFSHPIQFGLSQLPRSRSASASISDFRTALELNPTILGQYWPQHFEEICFRASEQ